MSAQLPRVAEVRHRYGLDRPIFEQYWDYRATARATFRACLAALGHERDQAALLGDLQLAIAAIFAPGWPAAGFLAAKWYGSVFDHYRSSVR